MEVTLLSMASRNVSVDIRDGGEGGRTDFGRGGGGGGRDGEEEIMGGDARDFGGRDCNGK